MAGIETAAEALGDLLGLLDLEQIEVDIFRGQSPVDGLQRIYGGQVAAQALIAAGRTVARGDVHSLHAYFLRPGEPGTPIVYQVDRIRDGRSFTTRRVVAIQHGRAIFHMSASFHIAESGLEHQTVQASEAPPPEELPTAGELLEREGADAMPWRGARLIDVRFVDVPPQFARVGRFPAHQRFWMRAVGALPDDSLTHACVVAYLSDMSLLDTVLLPHNLLWSNPHLTAASLDHAMWFHRPFRADEWLLYEQESPVLHGSRGFARGNIFTRDGSLVISVAQEGLLRYSGPAEITTPARANVEA